MLSTSMLTWAAAQDRVPIYELIRNLTPMDEARIEAAYAEWRRRAAAGERRHKVDWRTYPIPTPVEAAEPAPADAAEPVPAPVEFDESVDVNEAADPAPIEDVEEDEADDDADTPWEVAEAVEQILAVEEPEYISLDDFNLEPSEEEMREMEKVMAAEPVPETAAPATPTVTDDKPAVTDTTPEVEAHLAPEQPIEQRIDKLGKDATPAIYESILTSMAGDVDMLKAVTDAVIRDHTKRHRGTAAQRAFLAWLEEK